MSLISGSESKIYTKGVIGNVRKAQEDSYGRKIGTPNGDLFVVCDGMGGHVGGAMASSLAVESIIRYIEKEKYATPVEAMDGALQFANMQILGYAEEHPEYRGMGTTACIVLIRDTDVWIAHVGDSRIYLYMGKEKELHRITMDHSYVQTLVDAGEITDEEAEHHPNKNRIMKALGIKPELHPSFNFENKPIFVKNGDVFLICSDGLCGMIPDRTIERVLGEKLTIQQKGDKLIDLAMQGETVQPGGQDNCTVELIEIDNAVGKSSEFHSYNPYPKEKKTAKKGMDVKKWERIALIALVVLVVAGGLLLWLRPNLKGGAGNVKQTGTGDSISSEAPATPISKQVINQDKDDLLVFNDIKNTVNTWDETIIEEEIKQLEHDQTGVKDRNEFYEIKERYKTISQKVNDEYKKWRGILTSVCNLKGKDNINEEERIEVEKQLNNVILIKINGEKGWKKRIENIKKTLNIQE